MKKWYHEDWHFKIEVVRVGKENKAEECRLGFEPGDTFECTYETPAGFCPASFLKIFSLLEVVRCKGDLRYLGGSDPCETTLVCPDGVVLFRVTGEQRAEQ
ncbi:TIGR04076 family protein [candidate division NPL-UPA2 bacterium]|nr:TIGR04076 family protein [candidate division NPL-UPA2 bacterium]